MLLATPRENRRKQKREVMAGLIGALVEISKLPESDAAEWLSSAESAVEFLKENVHSDRMVLYASMPNVLIHAVLAPLDPRPQRARWRTESG